MPTPPRYHTILLFAALEWSACSNRKPPPAAAPTTSAPPAAASALPISDGILDAHVRMSAGFIPTMLQSMTDNGLQRVVNQRGGSRADHSLDLWMAMHREIKGRIVPCWNPPWSELARSGGDVTPLVHDLVDSVGMRYACVSAGLTAAPWSLDDPRLDPLWAKAGQLRVPVFLHAPAALAERHPKTRFVLSHRPTGDLEALLGSQPNLFVDLAAFGPSPPLDLIRGFPDRFVFGSGLAVGKALTLGLQGPAGLYGDVTPYYQRIRRALAGLPEDLRRRVLRDNLLAIF